MQFLISPNFSLSRISFHEMGVLTPCLCMLQIVACPPINMSQKGCWRMCLQSHHQSSPPTPPKEFPKFQNPMTTLENPPLCLAKYSIVQGKGWGWNHNINLFVSTAVTKERMQKFRALGQPLLEESYRMRERRKTLLIVATTI